MTLFVYCDPKVLLIIKAISADIIGLMLFLLRSDPDLQISKWKGILPHESTHSSGGTQVSTTAEKHNPKGQSLI